MKLEISFVDEHDFMGLFTLIVTVYGNATEINDVAYCMLVAEKYVNKRGFNFRECVSRGKPIYDPGKTVSRIMLYEKRFPSRYDPKHITFFNQSYTPEVKKKVMSLRDNNKTTFRTIEL